MTGRASWLAGLRAVAALPGAAVLRGLGATLVDLVLPTACAGCREPGHPGLCPGCLGRLSAAVPRRTSPDPRPAGLPTTWALGGYAGGLRAALLEFKERGRRGVAGPLGERLAAVVLAAVPGTRPVLLVPIPTTARAARRRNGDHMLLLARRAAVALGRAGRLAAVATPLVAGPRPDSAGLPAAARASLARGTFSARAVRLAQVRRAGLAGAGVVLVDDVITTGATLAAAADRLHSAGVAVPAAAVLAATERRFPVGLRGIVDRTGTIGQLR